MKYVIILVIVVVLVRIDVILRLFDKASEKVQKTTEPTVQPVDLGPSDQLIPMSEDKVVMPSDQLKFLKLIEEFYLRPVFDVRGNIVEFLKVRPNLFGTQFNAAFENAIFSLRDLMVQKNPELPNLLVDLMDILKDENQNTVKKFFSLMMNEDMEAFILAYSRTNDSNCMIAAVLADPLTDEAAYNELIERDRSLGQFLAKENIGPVPKQLAQNCQLVLRLHLTKLTPPDSATEGDEEKSAP